jgi:hypothetical protein
VIGVDACAVDAVVNAHPLCKIVRAAIPALDPLSASLSAY